MKDANFETLMRGGYVQTFPPQVELISEGDPSDFLHIVTDGSIELFASWNDRETMMATVRPVSTFILAATIKDADVRAAFAADNNFARAVVTELAQCYRSVVKNSKNIKLRTSIERLANYLIRQQANHDGAEEFELRIEKRRLASYLGMTPENLSRSIKSLRAYGVVINGSKVSIANPADLAGLAKPTRLIDDPQH
jgi:CRP/FNR family transcriptional activator FtrB